MKPEPRGMPEAFEDGAIRIPPRRSMANRYAYGLGVNPPWRRR